MFIRSTIQHTERCFDLIVELGILMGLRKLEYWCWMVIHILHSPSLAQHSNSNPNGFPYPKIPNPPTQPRYTLHHNCLSCQLHIFFNKHLLTSMIQRGNEACQIHLLHDSFSISHVHHPWKNWHSNLQIKSWTSFSCFVDSSLPILESTT